MLGWHSAPVLDDLSEYDVVPVPLLHIHPGSEDAMLTTGLLIYGQLDTGKLRSALKDLARLGEWRKIGCRMRRAATPHKYAFAIPRTFTPERAAFQYVEQDRTHETAAVGGIVPPRTSCPSFHPPITTVQHLYRPSQFPATLSQLLDTPSRRNESILSVSIVTFADATLLSLTVPHVFTDALGMRNIFSAWALVLSGRASEVPPVVGFEDDVLADFDGDWPPSVPAGARARPIHPLVMLRHVFLMLVDLALYRAETRIIFIPNTLLERQKTEANEDMRRNEQDSKLFVSTADVVSALIAKISILHEPPSNRNFSMGSLINARGRVPALASPAASAGYLGMAFGQTHTLPAPLRVIKSASIATVACMNRHAVALGNDPHEFAAMLGNMRRGNAQGRMAPVGGVGDATMHATNWFSDIVELDFSAALSGNKKAPSGKVAFVGGVGATDAGTRRFWSIVFSRDGSGVKEEERGVWIETAYAKYKWKAIEDYLTTL